MDHLSRLRTLIAADPTRMAVLRLVRELRLPDCWVAAGFVRSAVWDQLHGRHESPLPSDIDVIWFDDRRCAAELDVRLEAQLRSHDATPQWSVKNQARMHLRNGDHPYASATDAMTRWPETATAVAVRLRDDGAIEVAAPCGLDDLFDLVVRPTAGFASEKRPIYLQRLQDKNWSTTWPALRFIPAD